MKPLYPLLVIAAVCCFAPAMSNPVRDDKDELVPTPGSNCLQNAMNNKKDSGSILRFICAYMKLKVQHHKEDFIKAIKELEDATGCTTKDIFGTTESLEHLAMDENGVVTRQIIALIHMLEERNIPMQSVEKLCIILDNFMPTDSDTHTSLGEADQGHKRFTRQAGGLDILGLVPNLLGSVLSGGGLLSGEGVGGLLDLPLGLVGGVLNVPNKLGGLLDGATGGGGGGGGGRHKQAHGCRGFLDEALDLPTSLLTGLLGGGGQKQGGGIGGLVNTAVNLPTNLLSGILGGQKKGNGGLLNGILPTNLLGGVLGQGNLLGSLIGGLI